MLHVQGRLSCNIGEREIQGPSLQEESVHLPQNCLLLSGHNEVTGDKALVPLPKEGKPEDDYRYGAGA